MKVEVSHFRNRKVNPFTLHVEFNALPVLPSGTAKDREAAFRVTKSATRQSSNKSNHGTYYY